MHSDLLSVAAKSLDENARVFATNRQLQLTKPPGSLGMLEEIAIRLSAMQAIKHPQADKISISVFTADHGIATQGVSAFPQAVTTEMVKNFSRGGAAISVLAKTLNANLEVINLGTVFDTGTLPNVLNEKIASSTRDFSQHSAMNETQFNQALNAGKQAVERALQRETQLFIGGEMGIGNTTSATAIICAILGLKPEQVSGPGTGLNDEGLKNKISIIEKSLELHSHTTHNPIEILRHFGGFEIVALTGSFIASAEKGLPVLVDGFIASTAALCASRLCSDSEKWFLFAHTSAEPGHKFVLEAMNANPLLNLGMRLGEGSGAAVAVPLIQLACQLHNNMATFSEAGVSEKSE